MRLYVAAREHCATWLTAFRVAVSVVLIGLLASCGGSSTPQAETARLELLAGRIAISGGWADGAGEAARFAAPRGVAGDGNGNLYVADTENHVIRKIAPNGDVTTLAGSPGAPGSADGSAGTARFYMPRDIAVDGAGNLYVSQPFDHVIRKITPDGTVTTLAGQSEQFGALDGIGTAARFMAPAELAVDALGNVYVADEGNHRIRKIAPDGTVSTLAGGSPGLTDGLGPGARFTYPSGVAVDAAGTVYVADSGNHALRKILPNGAVTTLAAGETELKWPVSVAVDGAANLYVTLFDSPVIRKLDPEGRITTLAGMADTPGAADGDGAAARFTALRGISIVAGRIVVADVNNNAIRAITPSGLVTTLAGTMPTEGAVDGVGTAARFATPKAIAVDTTGHVYVADTLNHTVRRITPDGVVTTLAGSPGHSGSSDGTGGEARFYEPSGITVDGQGNLYVSDTGNNTIRKISPGGGVTTLAGTAGSMADGDGIGPDAGFWSPGALAVDGVGNLYVADTTWVMQSAYGPVGRLRKITPSGVVTTLAGGNPGRQDGTGSAASFRHIGGVACDHAGTIYVTDNFVSGLVRRISAEGVVTTIAGAPFLSESVDGTGAAAGFPQLGGLAVDDNRNVYIAESDSHLIRKVSPSRKATTIVGTRGQSGFQSGPLPGLLLRPTATAIFGNTLYVAADNGVARITNLQ